jgi:hypothetical protein
MAAAPGLVRALDLSGADEIGAASIGTIPREGRYSGSRSQLCIVSGGFARGSPLVGALALVAGAFFAGTRWRR